MRTKASNEWDRRGQRLVPTSKKKLTKKHLEEFVNRASINLPFFAKYFCHRQHSPAQVKMGKHMKEDNKTIGVFARQTGKTTVVGDYDVHELAFADYPKGENDFTIVFAPVLAQSQLIFGSVEKVIKNNAFLWSQVEKFQTGGRIVMKNGNELRAKTASPNAHIRGFSPTKIQLDESQDISDVKYYEDILPSGATTDAKIHEIGTPKKRNHFWKTFNHDSAFKKVLQPWRECPFNKPGYIEDCQVNMTKAKFDQEFNCIWNVDIGSAWKYEMIQKMCALPVKYYPPEQHVPYYAGIDVAKHPAETVLSIGKGVGKTLDQVLLLRIADADSYNIILNKLYSPLSKYMPVTCVDATPGSQGVVLTDILTQKFIEDNNHTMAYRIFPESYNNTMKAEMANDLDLLGESNRLKLLDDLGQKRQLIAFEKKESKAGNVIYFSEELHDICQADMLMVKAFLHQGPQNNQGFVFRSSGETAMDKGHSFVDDMPRNAPSW